MRKIVEPYSGTTVTSDYLGGFQYENNQLKFYHQPEGFVKKENNQYIYHFTYKDHLGNNRLTYADLNGDGDVTPGEIIEENNYYPFGLKHQGYNELASDVHKHKFLNREYQPELGLNTIATDYRHYDSALGRFNNMDALSELAYSQTPYRYGFNNPVYWTDPTGLFETRNQAMKWISEWGIDGTEYKFQGLWYIYSGGIHYYMDSGILHFHYLESSGGGEGNLDTFEMGYFRHGGGRPLGGGGGSSSGNSGSPNSPGGPSSGSGAAPGAPGGVSGAGPGGVSGGTSLNNIDWAQVNKDVASFGMANTVKTELIEFAGKIEVEGKSGELTKTTSSYLKIFKKVGTAGTVVNTVYAGYQYYENPTAGNATRLAVQGVAIGAAFIPGVGWAISLGIGTADMIWGDQFYEWIDNQ